MLLYYNWNGGCEMLMRTEVKEEKQLWNGFVHISLSNQAIRALVFNVQSHMYLVYNAHIAMHSEKKQQIHTSYI